MADMTVWYAFLAVGAAMIILGVRSILKLRKLKSQNENLNEKQNENSINGGGI